MSDLARRRRVCALLLPTLVTWTIGAGRSPGASSGHAAPTQDTRAPRLRSRGLDSPLRAPAGRYRLDRGASDDVDRAVEAVVRRMNFIARPIARARLRGADPLYERVTIAIVPAGVSTRFDAHAAIVSPLDGVPVRWTRENGDVFLVSTRLQADRLIQTFTGREGERENIFTLGPDLRTLTVNVTVSNPRLPQPLVYRLVYRRE